MSKAKQWVTISGGHVSESVLADWGTEDKLICSINESHPNAEKNHQMIALAPLVPELLSVLEYIINDCPAPGEDAILTKKGYNKACAIIAKIGKIK